MLWALSVLIGLLTAPLTTEVPRGGLDPSWGFAMHAWVTGSAGDVPVTSFTYGPLGFLTVPVVWGWTYVPALVFVLGVQVVLCRLLLARLSSVAPLWLAVAGTAVMAALVDVYVAETFLVTMALLAGHLLQTGVRRQRAWLLGGVVVAGLALLVKFSTGTVCLLLLAIVVLGLSRRLLLALGSVAAALLVSWLAFSALTFRPLGFAHWLLGSRQVAQGYPAMATEGFPDTSAHYLLGGLCALLLVGTAVLLTRRAWVPVACSAVVLLVTYLAFRQGFTRHDAEHEGSYLSALMLLPLALAVGRRSRFVLVPLVVAPMVLAVGWGQRYDPADRVQVLGRHLRAVVDPGHARDEGRTAMRAGFALPDDVQAALSGHRVQVDPYNTAVLWAYGLHWGPSEAWALYSSYTPWLDDRNARSIATPSGPDRILRFAGAGAVDGRVPDLESPRYQLTEQCRWRPVVTDGAWQVLEPGPDRCGAPRVLKRVRFVPRQRLGVPRAHPGSIVTVRFRLDVPASSTLASLLFKPRTERHIQLDGRWHRLVVANAGQPLLLTTPPGLAGGARSFAPLSTTSLAVDLPGEAVFEEVPVS